MSPKVNVEQFIKDLNALDDMYTPTNTEWTVILKMIVGLKWDCVSGVGLENPWSRTADWNPTQKSFNWDATMNRLSLAFPVASN